MARKRQASRFLRYKSYNWVNKDPIIDAFRTLRQDTGFSFGEITNEGGPASTTMRNWEHGITKRPQFCTIWAAARTMRARGIIASSDGYPHFFRSESNEPYKSRANNKRFYRRPKK